MAQLPHFEDKSILDMRNLVAQAEHLVLISHTNADGDAVGSLLGTYHVLHHLFGHKTLTMMLPTGCPSTMRHLPGSDLILNATTQRESCDEAMKHADLVIGVDFNVPSRTDMMADAILAATCPKILVDHHHGPDTEHFSPLFSQPEISSCCELLYWLLTTCWGKDCMVRDAAICLYHGIRTDTGGFAFSNDQPSLYLAAAELVEYDIQPAEIHNQIVNTFSVNRMQFYGYALSNLLHIFTEQRFAYFAIPLSVQQHFGIGNEDMEGLVNYTLMMRDIECGALIREEVNRTKISFRSKYTTDVNLVAQTLFEGGGHTRAAGATSMSGFENTMKTIEDYFVNRKR